MVVNVGGADGGDAHRLAEKGNGLGLNARFPHDLHQPETIPAQDVGRGTGVPLKDDIRFLTLGRKGEHIASLLGQGRDAKIEVLAVEEARNQVAQSAPLFQVRVPPAK